MKVLIIGGTRRCGPYLVRELLKKGHSVVCYHRGQHKISLLEGAEHIYGDRRDYLQFRKQMNEVNADVVIDMIAGDDKDVQAVVEAFRKRIRQYICISSFEVYQAFAAAWDHALSYQPVPIPEEAPKRRKLHLYGEEIRYEKLLVEKEAMKAHTGGDFAVTILRWPALYGPRDTTPREWYYVKQILDGRRKIAVPNGGQALFSRGYFENMAHSVLLAMEKERACGEIYNAADTEALSVKQIVAMVAEIMGHEWEIISVPRETMPPAPQSRALPCSCDPYDIEPHLLLDLTKIRSELGYDDIVPVRKAMDNTVQWLSQNPPPKGWMVVDYKIMDEAIRSARQPRKEL